NFSKSYSEDITNDVSNPFSAEELLGPFGHSTDYTEDLVASSISFGGGQTSVSMNGSRFKVLVRSLNGPFEIPYRLTVHVDGISNSQVTASSQDYITTNRISGTGDG